MFSSCASSIYLQSLKVCPFFCLLYPLAWCFWVFFIDLLALSNIPLHWYSINWILERSGLHWVVPVFTFSSSFCHHQTHHHLPYHCSSCLHIQMVRQDQNYRACGKGVNPVLLWTDVQSANRTLGNIRHQSDSANIVVHTISSILQLHLSTIPTNVDLKKITKLSFDKLTHLAI